MSPRKPLIGVTTSQRSGWRIFPLVALNIWLAGGRAQRWGAGRPADLDAVDAIVIGGGDDISPTLYGAEIKLTARLDPARDAFEHDLASTALGRNIPVLGICRGAQMLNVALGGTLHQDAWGQYQSSRKIKTILPKREICIEADTKLGQIAGTAPMQVNALHSQAVDRLGRGLRVAARDTSGMIQAVERVREPFALGVQWHPEHLIYARRQRAVFRALVQAAAARAGLRQQLPEVSAAT